MEGYIPPREAGNLQDYEVACKEFTWASVDKEFAWSEGAPYNVAYEAIDKHALNWRKNKIALYSITASDEVKKYTFGEMSEITSRFASGLIALGAKKGDRIFVYLDRTSELYMSMIGVTKMGGIAGPLFSALGPEAVKDRALDSGTNMIITSPYLYERILPILDDLADLKKIIIVGDMEEMGSNCVRFDDVLASGDPKFQAVNMAPNEPYIIHYTSGSTGKPKGVLLGHRAMTQQFITCRWVLDLREDDTYWCTADPGWVTGTSYGIFGPWYLGTSLVSYEGRFDARMWYGILDRFDCTVWYTAPTALRMLMRAGDEVIKEFDLSKVRHICSVGEPLNAEVVRWAMRTMDRRIHDTWWQTETISPLPGATALKPGSATRPFFGVVAGLVDNLGNLLEGPAEGNLVILDSWPGQMRTIYKDHDRFVDTYFKTFRGMYFTGDGARRDADGYYWITGRVDDVLNVSGHRMGTAEIESALVAHPNVAEAAVVGVPHALKGQGIYVYVTLLAGVEPSDRLRQELQQWVRRQIGPIAVPDTIQWAPGLPKTRSGKIMRRLLRKIATQDYDGLGDTSTLADPAVVQQLVDANRAMHRG